MNLWRILLALPIVVALVGLAKVAQYAAVDAFGATLGFEASSLVGAGPVLALYAFVAIRWPRLNTFGLKRGRP